jgi:hypothetical protein
MPDTVTFNREWYLLLASLRTHAARWTVFDAVCNYAFDGSEPSPETFDTDDEKRVFMSIKKEIKERNRKNRYYNNRKTKASNSPSNLDGGVFELEMEEASNLDVQFRRSKASKLDGRAMTSNQHRNTNTIVSPIVINNNTPKTFRPPTLEEVKSYCLERRNNVDPEEFHAYYSANNWMVGHGNKMRDYKAAIRYWESRERNKHKRPVRDYTGI